MRLVRLAVLTLALLMGVYIAFVATIAGNVNGCRFCMPSWGPSSNKIAVVHTENENQPETVAKLVTRALAYNADVIVIDVEYSQQSSPASPRLEEVLRKCGDSCIVAVRTPGRRLDTNTKVSVPHFFDRITGITFGNAMLRSGWAIPLNVTVDSEGSRVLPMAIQAVMSFTNGSEFEVRDTYISLGRSLPLIPCIPTTQPMNFEQSAFYECNPELDPVMAINFIETERFSIISEEELLARRIDLSGKIIILGNIENEQDTHYVPHLYFGKSYPGPLVHAQAINTILNGGHISQPAMFSSVILFGVLMGFLLLGVFVARLRGSIGWQIAGLPFLWGGGIILFKASGVYWPFLGMAFAYATPILFLRLNRSWHSKQIAKNADVETVNHAS